MTRAMFLEATILSPDDGGEFWFDVQFPNALAHKKFDLQAGLRDLLAWLRDPAADPATTFAQYQVPGHVRKVCYDHESGALLLYLPNHSGGPLRFDPNKDEDLARLVRRLKALAPLPHEPDAPSLPMSLPVPTAEQMANRTIYSTAMAASGSGSKRRKPQARYNKPTASEVRSQEIVKGILADILGGPQ